MPTTLFNEKLCFINIKPVSQFLHIYAAGILEPDKSYYMYRTRFPKYLFEYVLNGMGHVLHNGRKYTLKEGDLCIIKKCEKLTYYANKSDPYRKMWFSSAGLFIEKILEILKMPGEILVIKAEVSQLFFELFKILQQKGHDEKEISHVLLDMALVTNKAIMSVSGINASLPEKIRQYIDNHISDKYGLDKIADEFNISRRHLTRIFSTKYKQSICQYTNECRLAAASHFLIESDYNINEIAQVLNFCDQSYFSNQFKKRYGVYPSVYKKIHEQA